MDISVWNVWWMYSSTDATNYISFFPTLADGQLGMSIYKPLGNWSKSASFWKMLHTDKSSGGRTSSWQDIVLWIQSRRHFAPQIAWVSKAVSFLLLPVFLSPPPTHSCWESNQFGVLPSQSQQILCLNYKTLTEFLISMAKKKIFCDMFCCLAFQCKRH